MISKKISEILNAKGFSIYKLSKLTGIKYELLRRTMIGKRKLSADELILILEKADISFDDIK